jgi:hypothetical protein
MLEQNRNYEKSKGKIRTLWDDVLRLIAIEEELLEKLNEVERQIKTERNPI